MPFYSDEILESPIVIGCLNCEGRLTETMASEPTGKSPQDLLLLGAHAHLLSSSESAKLPIRTRTPTTIHLHECPST